MNNKTISFLSALLVIIFSIITYASETFMYAGGFFYIVLLWFVLVAPMNVWHWKKYNEAKSNGFVDTMDKTLLFVSFLPYLGIILMVLYVIIAAILAITGIIK